VLTRLGIARRMFLCPNIVRLTVVNWTFDERKPCGLWLQRPYRHYQLRFRFSRRRTRQRR